MAFLNDKGRSGGLQKFLEVYFNSKKLMSIEDLFDGVRAYLSALGFPFDFRSYDVGDVLKNNLKLGLN